MTGRSGDAPRRLPRPANSAAVYALMDRAHWHSSLGVDIVRIAHVAALLAEDNAYGGPLTVAVEQCSALAARGNEVTLYVGWDGRADPTLDRGFAIEAVRARRWLPTSGITGLFSAAMVHRVRREIAGFDVAHVHLGRDPITTACAAVAVRRTPTVLQTHGMVMPDERWRAACLDTLTVRDTLRRATAVLALTPNEQRGLPAVARRSLPIHRLPNGIGTEPAGPRAPSHPGTAPTVLFCARLHPRKRPSAFVRMCRDIQQRGVLARYIVAGPDEGELPDVLAAIAQARTQGVDIDYLGALSNAAARKALAAADVYVLPSDDEPFPMTVLEAMAAGTPTVVTDTCGLAETIVRTGAGVVAARDVSDLADAVTKLLDDGSHWAAVSAAGRRVVDSELSADAVAQRLEELYATAGGDADA